MPIKTQFKLGKHSTTLVQFGTGDIMITPSQKSKEDASIQYIHFTQSQEGEIGRSSLEYVDKLSDELPSIPVTLKFTDAKSIQVLIDQLEEVRKSLIEHINLAYSKEEYDIESESRTTF